MASVGTLQFRPMAVTEPGSPADSLFRVDWSPVAAEPAGAVRWTQVDALADLPADDLGGDPGVVFLRCPTGPDVREVTGAVLAAIQEWLADERFGAGTLVLVTEGAVGAGPGERVAGLDQAGVWGLVRVAHAAAPVLEPK